MKTPEVKTPKADDNKDKILSKLFKEAGRIKWGLILGFLAGALAIGCSVAAPELLGIIIDKFDNFLFAKGQGEAISGVLGSVLVPLIALAAVYVFYCLLLYLKVLILTNMVSRHFTYSLRLRISEKIKKLPVSFIDKTKKGDILSVLQMDVSVLGNTIHSVFDIMVMGAIQIAAILVMIFLTNWILALIIVVVTPLSVAFSAYLSKKSGKSFKNYHKEIGNLYSATEETYNNYITVKAFNFEAAMTKKHHAVNKKRSEEGRKGFTAAGMVYPAIVFFNSAVYIVICLIGGYFAIRHTVTVGSVAALLIYAKLLSSPLENIANGIGNLNQTKAAAGRVFNLLETEEMQDNETPIKKKAFKGSVEFKNVNFCYVQEKPLIEDLSFKVESGQKVAIVGPTGGGKTTIVNLLMRFYDVQSGVITVDGIDITKADKNSVRDIFSFVLQDTWLFNGTVYENISYGKPEATQEEIETACKNAYCHDFITKMPDGYNTIINENTTNISSGQKQLLTVARTLLRQDAILILDEATSNVDSHTELLIQKAFAVLMKDRTCFIIAHRLSTIINADIILVINDGKLIEKGNHSELMNKKGFYYQLYNINTIFDNPE